jgi:hypothetical protein
MWDFSYRISGRIVAAITEQKADLPSTRSPRFPKSSRHRSEKHWREKNAEKNKTGKFSNTTGNHIFRCETFHTKTATRCVCVCVGAAIRIKPWPASRSRTSSWPTRLRRAFKTTENKYLAAPRGVRAQHYSLPRHTHARTHTLQLVTNIADDSCEKLISFHVHQVGCDVGVARNFSARLDESRRFSILHSRLD